MITFEEAKSLLADSQRQELRDRAFGDTEVTWKLVESDARFDSISGYFTMSVAEIVFFCVDENNLQCVGTIFTGDEARDLRKCGILSVFYNDAGDDGL